MAAVYINVDEYFATINPLARKISHDLENIKQSYGDDWNGFSCDQQDKELWNNLVPTEITDKYVSQSSNEDLPSVFPKLKIPCGEKIVVDFDNDDGWTWTDEHSGPFSWRSRSQQDLSLFDDEPQKDVQKARNLKKTNNSNPPISQTNQSHSFVPEKSIWSSPFLASEKSALHNVDPDTLEIFQKFGITFGGKEDDDMPSSPTGADEDSSLLTDVDSNRLQLSLDTELLTDDISDGISESTPSSVDADMSVSVASTTDTKPGSPSDVASYTRDMESYQAYFSDAYEQSHQSPVTEQPRSASPVIPLKQPLLKPASPATPLKEPKPVSPVAQPKSVPRPVSPVAQHKSVPRPASPVAQPKPASPVTQSKPEPVLPVESSDQSKALVSLSVHLAIAQWAVLVKIISSMPFIQLFKKGCHTKIWNP
ncbi:hypothetical protein NP493_270g00038 [Ridgeia piscesae]|uniref:DUF4706 domain-containing protein n=1 Tax=Ridgeia piscesae TaxID=27915 RepID=A0AAD9UCJ0_RIDPI|nr:hypothetical protein NP493_270g00038 [Ridgeia piscesae]